MGQRIETMITAVEIMQPPLAKFYDLLSDEQKAGLTALGNDQRQSRPTEKNAGSLAQSCGVAPSGVMEWPAAEIDGAPDRGASRKPGRAAERHQSGGGFRSASVSTPYMQAVKMVSLALNDFYGTMSDEQKAQFEAIGPQRTTRIPAARGYAHKCPQARPSQR